MKNVLKFLMFLIPLILTGFIFRVDPAFYNGLNKPFFTLPASLFSIFWIIIFILLSISSVIVSNKISIFNDKDYLYSLIAVYVCIYSYMFLFFGLKSPLFGFIGSFATLVSSIFLTIETKRLIDKNYILLIPLLLQSTYGTILSAFIMFMNF